VAVVDIGVCETEIGVFVAKVGGSPVRPQLYDIEPLIPASGQEACKARRHDADSAPNVQHCVFRPQPRCVKESEILFVGGFIIFAPANKPQSARRNQGISSAGQPVNDIKW